MWIETNSVILLIDELNQIRAETKNNYLLTVPQSGGTERLLPCGLIYTAPGNGSKQLSPRPHVWKRMLCIRIERCASRPSNSSLWPTFCESESFGVDVFEEASGASNKKCKLCAPGFAYFVACRYFDETISSLPNRSLNMRILLKHPYCSCN